MQDPEEANSESKKASERKWIAQLLSFRGSLRSDVSRFIIVIKVLFCIGWTRFENTIIKTLGGKTYKTI
jgi:hypothetical protein